LPLARRARIAYKAITQPVDPVNEGSFTALDIILPEGNFMMARHPIPMQGWSLMLPTVADTIVAALAPAMKDKAPAGHHADLGGSAFSASIPKPSTASSYRASTAAAGAAGQRRTAKAARSRSVRAMCATAPSKRSS